MSGRRARGSEGVGREWGLELGFKGAVEADRPDMLNGSLGVDFALNQLVNG